MLIFDFKMKEGINKLLILFHGTEAGWNDPLAGVPLRRKPANQVNSSEGQEKNLPGRMKGRVRNRMKKLKYRCFILSGILSVI